LYNNKAGVLQKMYHARTHYKDQQFAEKYSLCSSAEAKVVIRIPIEIYET
jgi:hypothetical protein